jgi:holo-[acyl-carrier protein] synthase
MIVGLGVDIAEVDRVEAAIGRRGEAFLKRVFTPAEIAYCERHRNSSERYAGRFAAKEAAMKALGTGWRRGVRWLDIEIVRNSSGKPSLVLHGESRRIADRLGVQHISLSITHSGNTALAEVIFED